MKKLLPGKVQRQKTLERESLIQRKRWKKWRKQKNRNKQGRNPQQRNFDKIVSQAFHIAVPDQFSIKRYPNEVFKFVATLKGIPKRSANKYVHISLKKCTYISNGAIALLISCIKELKEYDIEISGNYPKDPQTRKVLERSGFFQFVVGNVSEENKETINTIVQQGLDVVDSARMAPIVTAAMKFLWGKPFRNPRLQSLLIELMANSVNHAFTGKLARRWYLSVSYDEIKKSVSFTFIDNGFGINKTLRMKFFDKITAMILDRNIEILNAAFDGKFGSRTKERKRGRGLPSIKKCFVENYISNLVVITNDVYLDFGGNNSKTLAIPFDGTCYYWELDLNCVEWTIL